MHAHVRVEYCRPEGRTVTDYHEVADRIALPVLVLFIVYVLGGRSFVTGLAGPTVALTVEGLLVGLILFVIVSDFYRLIERWRGDDEE